MQWVHYYPQQKKTIAGSAQRQESKRYRRRKRGRPLGLADVATSGARGNSLDCAAAVCVSAGKPIDFLRCAVYPQCETRVRVPILSGLSLTVRPCVSWPRRTIPRRRRRGRGSCRTPARTRSPSCKARTRQQRIRKAASDAQRVSRGHGTYYLQLKSAQIRRQFLTRLLCHYSTAVRPSSTYATMPIRMSDCLATKNLLERQTGSEHVDFKPSNHDRSTG